MTTDLEFHEPVLIRIGDSLISEVRSPLQARDALTGDWPDTRGKWYYAANRACRAAVEGRASVHVARRIFLNAVQESRLQA